MGQHLLAFFISAKDHCYGSKELAEPYIEASLL